MNNFTKKIIIAVILSACITETSVNAISDKAAALWSMGGGAALGTLAGALTYVNTDENNVAGTLVGLGVGGLAWWIVASALSELTPSGRIKAASKIINTIEADSFITHEFATNDDLLSYVIGQFGPNWPLVLARKHVVFLADQLRLALAYLVYPDIGNDEASEIAATCRRLEVRAQSLAPILEARRKIIFEHQDYYSQDMLYRQDLKERLRRADEQRKRDLELNRLMNELGLHASKARIKSLEKKVQQLERRNNH